MTSSTWLPENHSADYSVLDWLAIRLLRCGKVPRHVAFIMDGNRRYASNNKMEKIEGHSKGFDKMAQVLQWCNDLGVKEVTVYAFSIENFKRSDAEVSSLLDLARDKFRRLLDERERLREQGVRVRVIGNVSLLPLDLRSLIGEAEAATAANNRRLLNVAFAYTSREEIAQAVRQAATGVKLGLLQPEDITQEVLEMGLYTGAHNSVDLLIRTSGEVRLSDFLLWQTSSAVVYFTPALWPDFSVAQLASAVFAYQRRHYFHDHSKTAMSITRAKSRSTTSIAREARIERFASWLKEQRRVDSSQEATS